MMQLGDVAALDVPHLALADPGLDEELYRASVLVGSAGLAVVRYVVLEEPLAELLHGRGLAARISGGRRVAAALGLGDRRHGSSPRRLGRHRAVTPQGDAPHSAIGAELRDIVLAPRASDADPEAGKVVIPVKLLGAVARKLVDGAFGDLEVGGHGGLPAGRGEKHSTLGITWETSGFYFDTSQSITRP